MVTGLGLFYIDRLIDYSFGQLGNRWFGLKSSHPFIEHFRVCFSHFSLFVAIFVLFWLCLLSGQNRPLVFVH